MLSYLASPYSHPDQAIKEQRFKIALEAAGVLMKAGLNVFSPISHSHPIDPEGTLFEDSHGSWMKQDIAVLKHCQELIVLKLEGWDKSKGVAQEIDVAKAALMPVVYMTLEDIYAFAHSISGVHPPKPLRAVK